MIDTVCVIVQKRNHFLLVQRSLSDTAGGTWTYPGGKKDPEDNNLIETAHRELLEETELDGSDFHLLFQTLIDKYRLSIFACLKWIGQPQPGCDDIIGTGWFTWTEIYTMGESLSPHINNILPELAYFTQHYRAHPGEWK